MRRKDFLRVLCCAVLISSLSACNMSKNEIISNSDQAQINVYMEQGEVAYQNKGYEAAKEAYTNVIQLDETYLEAYIYRAKTKIKQADMQGAKQDLFVIEKKEPADKPASYYEVLAEYEVEQRNYPKALEAIEHANTFEQTPRRQAIQGIIQYHLHKNDQAKNGLLIGIQNNQDTELATYYYLLTELAIYEADYANADKYLEQLKTIEPNESKYDAMQGYVLLQQDMLQESIDTNRLQQIEQLMTSAKQKDLEQQNAITCNYLGLILFREEKLEEALPYFDQAIRLNQEHAAFYNNRALVYYQLLDLTTAYQDLSKAIELDKLEPEFYLGRAYVSVTREDEHAAIGDFNQAVRLDKNYFERVPDRFQEYVVVKEDTTNIKE